jgi:hypothetical protein
MSPLVRHPWTRTAILAVTAAQAAFQYPASLTESTQPLRRGRATSRRKPKAEALGDARSSTRGKVLESAAFERVIYDPRRIIDLTSTE